MLLFIRAQWTYSKAVRVLAELSREKGDVISQFLTRQNGSEILNAVESWARQYQRSPSYSVTVLPISWELKSRLTRIYDNLQNHNVNHIYVYVSDEPLYDPPELTFDNMDLETAEEVIIPNIANRIRSAVNEYSIYDIIIDSDGETDTFIKGVELWDRFIAERPQPTEQQPTEQQPTEQQPTNQQPTEQQPTETLNTISEERINRILNNSISIDNQVIDEIRQTVRNTITINENIEFDDEDWHEIDAMPAPTETWDTDDEGWDIYDNIEAEPFPPPHPPEDEWEEERIQFHPPEVWSEEDFADRDREEERRRDYSNTDDEEIDVYS